ncbi:hypothetical protein [Thermococcus sp.]|uniref:hypothetical protein n=1 Tax=Thermococcus sp. TaxID=35749 RepID=UPI002607C9D6|nr:hypothetical protein [Thermococcus sp.]
MGEGMKVWEGVRLYENTVCRSPEDLFLMIQEALRIGSGALLRVFSKDRGSYYVHALFDDEKLLLIEVIFMRTGGRIRGEGALRPFLGMMERPFIADVYSLGDGEIKDMILTNLDLYDVTPHVFLFELFTPKLWRSPIPPAIVESENLRSLE